VGALGKRLIAALLHEKDSAELTRAGVGEHNLFDDAKTAYNWAISFHDAEGFWPTAEMLHENTGIELPDSPEPLSYLADLVRKRTLGKAIETRMKDAIAELEGRDPDEALRLLNETASALRPLSVRSKVTKFVEDASKRVGDYLEEKKLGVRGMPTPWKSLDHVIQGWIDGTLNVFTAMQNTGKTWAICVCADNSLEQNQRVLLVTMEMAAARIHRRLDAIHYRMPWKDLRDWELDVGTVERWEREASKMDFSGDILIADKKLVRRVSDVTALVNEHKPDIVYIDGGYRFEGNQAGSSGKWENTVDIVTDLQLAAEVTEIPWVVSTQHGDAQTTGKDPKRGPKMRAWNVRYGKEWTINPDNVIGLFANEDMRLMQQLEISFLKIRDGAGETFGSEFRINWNMKKMDFSEIVVTEDDGAPGDTDEGAAHKVDF